MNISCSSSRVVLTSPTSNSSSEKNEVDSIAAVVAGEDMLIDKSLDGGSQVIHHAIPMLRREEMPTDQDVKCSREVSECE